MFTVGLKPGVAERIVWNQPDSVAPPALCSLCHGALPEVPFQLWLQNGAAAALCDPCANASLNVRPNLKESSR
jgi:hypothetical protein